MWRVGLELELLAPPGSDRRTLAAAIAGLRPGGSVRRVFHLESEPSAVPGRPVFNNLTLGFEAVDPRGELIARCVDDLTLQADLDREAPPRPGWFRLVSDDVRLLRLAARHADMERDLPEALAPVAALFGTTPEPGPGGMLRVVDDVGNSVLIGAPLPGERERPCELVTPPLGDDRVARLGELVSTAVSLGFLLPREGALHIHYDAAALRDARIIGDLVRFFVAHGGALRRLVGTSAHLRRVGTWSPELIAAATAPGFADLDWPSAERALRELAPTKFCDFNLSNLVFAVPDKDTFEVRILRVSLDLRELLASVELFEAILIALRAGPIAVAATADPRTDLDRLLGALPLSEPTRRYWLTRLAALDG